MATIAKSVACIALSLSMILTAVFSKADSQAPSEEARRHLNRGMAAVEMAKDPTDYDLAIEEFQNARRLAPEWPDVYYNLGLIQERVGKYKDAADSLRQYLRLSPNATDAETIRTMVDKLEFKAEQVITDDEALDIFASLKDSNKWQIKPMGNTRMATLSVSFDTIRSWRRDTLLRGQGLSFEFWCGSQKNCCPTYNGICPGGAIPIDKKIQFDTFFFRSEEGKYNSFYDFRLEVVSRNKVTMTIREKGSFGPHEYVYEFVRR